MSEDEQRTEAQEIAAAAFAAQPFSALLGAQLTRFDDGVAEIVIPRRDELLQQNGFMHGGVIAYAIDNAITFAAGTMLGTEILTSGITVANIRPARGDITAVATVVGTTKNQAVMRCEVYAASSDGTPVLVASGQGTVARIRPSAP